MDFTDQYLVDLPYEEQRFSFSHGLWLQFLEVYLSKHDGPDTINNIQQR